MNLRFFSTYNGCFRMQPHRKSRCARTYSFIGVPRACTVIPAIKPTKHKTIRFYPLPEQVTHLLLLFAPYFMYSYPPDVWLLLRPCLLFYCISQFYNSWIFLSLTWWLLSKHNSIFLFLPIRKILWEIVVHKQELIKNHAWKICF